MLVVVFFGSSADTPCVNQHSLAQNTKSVITNLRVKEDFKMDNQ